MMINDKSTKELFTGFETDNLMLRQICMDDKEDLYKQYSDPQICKFMMDFEPFTSVETAEEVINWYLCPEPGDHNNWVILRKTDGAFLGTCGYHNWDKNNNICDIGFDLMWEYWGRGYMTEALTALIDVGFESMGLNRIQGLVFLGNEKAIRLMLRLGFKKEGIIRDRYLFRGSYYDHYCLSLLKREWKSETNTSL